MIASHRSAAARAGISASGVIPIACLAETPDDLHRLLVGLVADEIARQRGRTVERSEWQGWGPTTTVDEDGLGVDSLARLELIARVSRYFGLHRAGLEDYLLLERRLGDWAHFALEALRRCPGEEGPSLVLETSGSTGQPKLVPHSLIELDREATALSALFPERLRVVSMVPPQHIYGLLFTVILPRKLGLPVIEMRGRTPGAVSSSLAPGDLVIATPFLWEAVADGGSLPDDVTGASATAALPAGLWSRLSAAGLSQMTEIYGSTETGGLGYRRAAVAPFAPLAHIREGLGADGRPALTRSDGTPIAPPDRLVFGSGGFRVDGRADGAVQVGGTNVYPERVAEVIAAHPEVVDCAVRLDGAAASARLKALVVPRLSADAPIGEAETARLVAALRTWCSKRLSPPERPARIDLASVLPRTAMGKLMDWS